MISPRLRTSQAVTDRVVIGVEEEVERRIKRLRTPGRVAARTNVSKNQDVCARCHFAGLPSGIDWIWQSSLESGRVSCSVIRERPCTAGASGHYQGCCARRRRFPTRFETSTAVPPGSMTARLRRNPYAIALSIVRGEDSPLLAIRASESATAKLRLIMAGKSRGCGAAGAPTHRRNTTPSARRVRTRPSPGDGSCGSASLRGGLASCHNSRRVHT